MSRKIDEGRVAEAARLYHSARLTQAEVARVLEVDVRTVRRWLAGTARRPGPRPRPGVRDQLILDLRDRSASISSEYAAYLERAGYRVPRKGRPLSFAAIAALTGMSKTGVRMRYYALTGRARPDRAKAPARD